MILKMKTWLAGGTPEPPTEDEMQSFYEYDDLNFGSYPSPQEVYEWDVEFFTERLATPLHILIVWKYVATRRRVPRFVRTAAWKLCRPWFRWA